MCHVLQAPRQAREKPSVTCLPPPPVAAAASDEPSLLPPPSSRPLRSRSEVRRQLAATPVVARRFGSTQGARRPLANLPSPPPLPRARPLPLRVGSPRACSRRRSERHATRRIVATDHQLWGSLCRSRSPCRSAVRPQPPTHIRVLSSIYY